MSDFAWLMADKLTKELLKRCEEWFASYMHDREDYDEATELLAALRAADEPTPELPYHLRPESPPLLQCSSCGRKSWTTSEYLGICGMRQPSGLYCDGVMRRAENREVPHE